MPKRCPNGSRKKNGTCVKYTKYAKRCPNGSRKNKWGECIPRVSAATLYPYSSPSPYASPANISPYASPENRHVFETRLPLRKPEYNRRENLLRLHKRIHNL